MKNTIIKNDSKYVIFLLVGRGQSSNNFLKIYNNINFNLVALEPEEEWYPLPNGIDDQFDSVIGIKNNVPNLFKTIKKIRKSLKILKENTILIGFSAGAVMMLELISYNEKPYHSAICHAGAILDTNQFPIAKNNTPILLIHSENDDCFKWEERYLPMKKCLIEKKYNLSTIEKSEDGHDILLKDIHNAFEFIKLNNK